MSDTINSPTRHPASIIAEFSPWRLYWLVRNRALQDLVSLGIGAAVILGLNLLVMVFDKHLAFFNYTNGALWTIAIMAVCFISASGAFREMNSGKSGTDWLLLPATPLEKYLSAVVELVILIPLVALLAATAISALLAGLQFLLAGYSGTIWTPLEWKQAGVWGCFMVTTLTFLTGSAVFRKQAFMKTLGIMILVAFALSMTVTIGALLLHLGGHGSGSFNLTFSGLDNNILQMGGKPLSGWAGQAISTLWGILYFGLLPLAALAFGYFKVREKEAKDAVQ